MFPHPSPMMLGGGVSPATFVSAGALNASTTIPVSTSGAQVGDLIFVHNPYDGANSSFTGWTTFTNGYSGGGYTSCIGWKILSSTADISWSSSYGHCYGIYRGPTSVAQNAFLSGNPITITTPGSRCAGLILIASDQANVSTSSATNFVNRAQLDTSGVFTQTVFDWLTSPQGGSVQPSNYRVGTGSQLAFTAFELRA